MTDLIERLKFELRDWKEGDRFHFVDVNALLIKQAADALAENCRLRDLYAHHLREVTDALSAELYDYECVDENGLIEWLGEAMGRRIIRAQMAERSARQALAAGESGT